MSRNSTKAVDFYCEVLNWDESIMNCFPEEVAPWSKKRDKVLARYRAQMAKITREEFLAGRWGDCPMERRIDQWNRMVDRAEGKTEGIVFASRSRIQRDGY